VKTLILGAIGQDQIVISESELHPSALALTDSALQARDGSTDFTSPGGKRLQVLLTNNRRDGDDLLSALRLQMNGEVVFDGRLSIRKAFSREKVTLTYCLVGAVELFYDHLLQGVVLDPRIEETEMQIGVLSIKGTISRPEVIREVLTSTIERRPRSMYPGFDHQLLYGIFPDEGFHHFFGDSCRLVESAITSARDGG
jgi:hypothetical protein